MIKTTFLRKDNSFIKLVSDIRPALNIESRTAVQYTYLGSTCEETHITLHSANEGNNYYKTRLQEGYTLITEKEYNDYTHRWELLTY